MRRSSARAASSRSSGRAGSCPPAASAASAVVSYGLSGRNALSSEPCTVANSTITQAAHAASWPRQMRTTRKVWSESRRIKAPRHAPPSQADGRHQPHPGIGEVADVGIGQQDHRAGEGEQPGHQELEPRERLARPLDIGARRRADRQQDDEDVEAVDDEEMTSVMPPASQAWRGRARGTRRAPSRRSRVARSAASARFRLRTDLSSKTCAIGTVRALHFAAARRPARRARFPTQSETLCAHRCYGPAPARRLISDAPSAAPGSAAPAHKPPPPAARAHPAHAPPRSAARSAGPRGRARRESSPPAGASG